MLAPGHTLAGRYHLEAKVATGGVGQVWQATDTVLGRKVAVKVLLSDRPEQAALGARFLDEARTMAALDHPGVVGVHDYGEHEGLAYLVMAYVHGEPLSELIASRGRLTPAETMAIVARVARALDAAHRAGIVHRDVKPSNLILQDDGSVVLVDFGIAHQMLAAAHLTAADEVIGTPLYIAPEQVSKQPITPATDVYALGAVAYHCLAGQPPFPGDNAITVALQHLSDEPPPLPDDVPVAARVLVATAMAKDPGERFPSAAAMAEAAQAWTASGPATATASLERTAALPRPPAPARPYRHTVAALSLGCLAILAMMAFAFRLGTPPADPGLPSDQRPVPTVTKQVEVPAGNGRSRPSTGPSPGPSALPGPTGGATASGAATPAPATVAPQPSSTGQSTPDPTGAPAAATLPATPVADTP